VPKLLLTFAIVTLFGNAAFATTLSFADAVHKIQTDQQACLQKTGADQKACLLALGSSTEYTDLYQAATAIANLSINSSNMGALAAVLQKQMQQAQSVVSFIVANIGDLSAGNIVIPDALLSGSSTTASSGGSTSGSQPAPGPTSNPPTPPMSATTAVVTIPPSPPAGPCSVQVTYGQTINGSDTYNYSLVCQKGTTPYKFSIAATKDQVTFGTSGGTAVGQGVQFQSYDTKKSLADFAITGAVSNPSFQIAVPAGTTQLQYVTYYVTTDPTTDVTSCLNSSLPSGCSTGQMAVPVAATIASASVGSCPPGFDCSKGNTLYTRLTLGFQVASSSGASPQANAVLDLHLTAPVGWATRDCDKAKNAKDCKKNPLNNRLWAYLDTQISSVPQSNLALSSFLSPSSVVLNNANKDVTSLVQGFSTEPGLEILLFKGRKYKIPGDDVDANRLGIYAFGAYGISVPLSGISNPTTIYNLNGDLYALYNVPSNLPGTPGYNPKCGLANPPASGCGVPGTTPFKYLALAQESPTQFLQSYYGGLKIKTFDYQNGKLKNDYPGEFEVGVGQDQQVTGYGYHGLVLRMKGFYSLPFYTPLHVFGSIDLALSHLPTQNVAQFVPADSSITTSSPAVYLQPTRPPVRSLYAIGLGLDLIEVIKQATQGKIAISQVSPSSPNVAVDQQQQFQAAVTGASDSSIDWTVAGATTAVVAGTIDAKGNYTAPHNIPTPPQVTVTATAHADSSKSTSTKVTIVAAKASDAPSKLSVDSSVAGQLSLSWNLISGATYNVYKSETAGAEAQLTTGVTSTGYTDKAVTSGKTYYYQVTAVNASGVESGKSNEASGTAH
jgi:hypothetical protein